MIRPQHPSPASAPSLLSSLSPSMESCKRGLCAFVLGVQPPTLLPDFWNLPLYGILVECGALWKEKRPEIQHSLQSGCGWACDPDKASWTLLPRTFHLGSMSQQPEANVTGCPVAGVMPGPQELVLNEVAHCVLLSSLHVTEFLLGF